ncbi:MAG TPA: OsmC family protein [Gemmatimonadaceae bacterium]|jgi:putative redox protein|nr:OsmC family protein [Gemmatimonadaceae bacterium]
MGASTQEFAVPPGPSGPVITRSEISWRGDRSFNAGPAGRQHVIDGAAKAAPGPVETLLSTVAACSSLDIIDILAKRRTPVEKLSVHVTAERRPEFPRRVMRLEVEFRVDGAEIEREHAERAIQLSFERYCSVASSLAPDIVIETRLTLNGATEGAMRQKVWRPTI